MFPTAETIHEKLLCAMEFRTEWVSGPHDCAFRLINGFTEGLPELSVDVFGRSAVLHDYSEHGLDQAAAEDTADFLLNKLDFLKCVVWKRRSAREPEARNGILLRGEKADTRIREHGVTYAVDLQMNRDNSFYADTRNLRKYLIEHSQGKSVLNTFAYTGSLGVAAWAGGAEQVLQTDLSDRFLELGRRSCTLNRFYFNKKNYVSGDFFPVVSRLRKSGRHFDTVILDPPFFSRTGRGQVDLAGDPVSLINKVRPLAGDGGVLIAVNNSLYLSGEDYLRQIDSLCDGTYLKREELVPIPADFTGPAPDYGRNGAANPAPFNHPTKIVVLRVRLKESAGTE